MICLNLYFSRLLIIRKINFLRFPISKSIKDIVRITRYFSIIEEMYVSIHVRYTFLDDCMYTNDGNTDMQA